MVTILTAALNVLLVVCSFFLICLVLIQRGKGGGLAGAFGGVGGSSAFGTKAGDVFTRVTIITAIIWFVLNIGLVVLTNQRQGTSAAAGLSSSPRDRQVPITDKARKGKAESPSSSSKRAAAPSSSTSKADESGLPPVFEDSPDSKAPAKGGSGKNIP